MRTATITDIKFQAQAEVPAETLLGEEFTHVVEIDSFVAIIDIEQVKDHPLFFKPEAIANRMLGYGLAAEKEAVEALVRELVWRWSPSLKPMDPSDPVHTNGGIDGRIAITWSPEAEAKCPSVLEPHLDRIAESRKFFQEQAEPEEVVE